MAGFFKSLALWLFFIFFRSSGYFAFEDDEFVEARGLFPSILNLATNAIITVNATCGETGPEVYCKLVEHVEDETHMYKHREQKKEPQCGVCDAKSTDKKHPIAYAVDGTNQWWQSPSLQYGKHFEWVTITLDLRQVYQVAYVIVKAAISPRPGNWILERSLDGIIYKPWQFYAVTDSECWSTYGIRPTIGKPRYRSDDDVICTSYYSKLNPFEDGEIHTSLINGRPGADGPSFKLMEFTKARYVRLRLQKIRTLNADLMSIQTGADDPERSDKTVTRRYFYSIKDISVGGHCLCFGHASKCAYDRLTGKQQCICKHNTCGENCESCCPLYNQKMYRPGTKIDAASCMKCECYGHSESCHYDETVAVEKRSINTEGIFDGGGVCENCKHHTQGVNCEICKDGYFRPSHVARNDSKPCRKCHCLGPGMTGDCVKDDSHVEEGLQPGDCFCKAGFDGKKCNRCAIGYKNYPSCEPCPCHSAGTLGGKTCEKGDCICKAHVEGPRCDRCKRGFYHLSASNPHGCLECFCFGLTDECFESDWGVEIVKNLEKWKVTDIAGKIAVKPTLENGDLVIANDDIQIDGSYYWLAPDDYLGKKLYSYGADLKFSVSYVVARGDTSGTYTEDADVIIQGDGFHLGYKWRVSPDADSISINLPLREDDWFMISPSGERSAPVSREVFTRTLNNLTRLMIRAKFHTDQIVGKLHNVGMEIASKESKSLKKLKSVEKCTCPPGYSGLSCEMCAPGYREVRPGVCEKCDCHNHAESCDAGRCERCMHHTTGPKCGSCVRGYYGDATVGTPNDCKRCACPLEEPENNFSPSCSAVTSSSGDLDYICDQCQPGYGGNKCERCSDGYFGNPQARGGYCQPCDCNNNADISKPGWCDSLTGQCKKCLGNTGGWNCAECLPGHFGDPTSRSCKPCLCSAHGSFSEQCNHDTGQCLCKANFIGRTCDRCSEGYGYVELGCIECSCNTTGSRSTICDPFTGHCPCKPGVFGTKCDSCKENHYGFSVVGCTECKCNPYGSLSLDCAERSGMCTCKPHVTGQTCNVCEDGYWNLNSGNGCEKCHCNRTGSVASICDKNTGECSCKPGVGGLYCDRCLPGYFKFGKGGCRKCDPCDAPGHICHPESGRCVCPTLTVGRKCQKCAPNAWGYDPLNGCKPCECNPKGSVNQRCDPLNGDCMCAEGFEGRHCDHCRHGYYGFPNCHKCNCNMAGTDTSRCNLKDGVCHCNEEGQCFCKEHVVGKTCDKCMDDAFGLSAENRKGCHSCFCFKRTRLCSQANLFTKKLIFPPQDVFMDIGTSEIPVHLGFDVIPHNLVGKRLGIPYVLDKPLYWSLPKERLGDKILSYNGFLTFYVESHSASHFPDQLLETYPLVVLQGNQRLVLLHPHSATTSRRPYKVKLSEDHWINLDNPQYPVRKSLFMVALQNVQTILIRATDGPDVKYALLHNITLDEAVTDSDGRGNVLAEGIEACRCPRQYTGTSCQDPAPGYYRKRKPNYLDSKDVLDLVGWSEPCDCNNHTTQCDKETGICINCGGNTIGDHCDHCAKGYYGNPEEGPCRPCSCPHHTNSFSDTCIPDSHSFDYICIDCQTGYTGKHCEKCDKGYFGNPLLEGGRCSECRCNAYGSKSRECDPLTGQCQCRDGISGRDCTVCSHGFILTEYGCKSCEDECTGVLLNELYEMKLQLESMGNLTDLPKLPWGYLRKMNAAQEEMKPQVHDYKVRVKFGKDLINNFTFYFDLEAEVDNLFVQAVKFVDKAIMVATDAKQTLDEAEKLFLELNKNWRNIKDLALELDRHGQDPTGLGISTERMLKEAERILLEIQSRNFIPAKENSERELRKSLALLEKIRKLTRDRGHIDNLPKKINHLNDLINEMVEKINDGVRKPAGKAKEVINRGKLRLNDIKGSVNRISGTIDTCNSTLMEAVGLLGHARASVIDAAVKLEYLPRLARDMGNATEKLDEHRSILASLNPKYRVNYVIPAQEHADELERQSRRLADLFVATKELSEFPLQAAKAYQNIIDAITDAEKAALEAERAAENAFKQAYPGTDDALTAQAAKARARSVQLLHEAQQLNEEDVPELKIALQKRKLELDKLSKDVASGKKQNKIINREIDALPTDVSKGLRNALNEGKAAEAKANLASNKVNAIDDLINNELKPRYEAVHAGTVGGLENLTKIIMQARDGIKRASNLADRADISSNQVKRHHVQLQLDLKNLKDKILLARQKSASIRVALTTDEENKCFRSFRPRQLQPSTTNNIILNYAIKTPDKDSLLFFLGSAKEEDFLAIEMKNRKIRFLWNVGGGTQVIQHNISIETNNDQLLTSEKWFKIEANRIGNLGTLSVKRTPDGRKQDPYEVSGASPVGFTKIDLDETSNLFVGGFPENFLIPSELETNTFAGCLYELLLDGKTIGLWNFESNLGCSGCKEGATEDIDISAFEFQGRDSYAIVQQNPYYRKSDMYAVLNFKTLNEDALLFLSSNSRTGDLISLELKGGKVVYQLRFNNGRSKIFLETKRKYNTGEWTRVEAAREKFEAQILVEEEFLEETHIKEGSFSLDLNDSPLYYGGVPPNFSRDTLPEINFKSFFGCLRDLQMDSTAIALSRGSFYGMTVGCTDKPLKVATFSGSGFLEFNTQALTTDSSISMSFLTYKQDAFLMISVFNDKEGVDNLQHYYSLALKDGRVEARLSIDSAEISMVSDRVLTSGRFHTVTIIRKNRRLLLLVDDEEEADMRIPRNAKDSFVPKRKGGMFFGGVKENDILLTPKMVASMLPLVGIIRDVITNGRLLAFGEAIDFKGVDFGLPDLGSLVLSEDFYQGTHTGVSEFEERKCYSDEFAIEQAAYTTSLNEDEFSQIKIEKKDFVKNFNLTFEFKAYDRQNSLLVLMKNNVKKKQQLMIHLHNHSVIVELQHHRFQHKKISSRPNVQREKWNRIELVKSAAKLTLYLNKKVISSIEVPKKLLFRESLFIGKAPRIAAGSAFHGCFRNVHINGNLKKPSVTGPPCSENAIYFTGKNYVLYDSALHMDDNFSLDFDFRTSKLFGDIIYLISEDSGFSIKVGIAEGEVLATIYSAKHRQRIQLSESLKESSICYKSWHKVSLSINFSNRHGIFSLQLDDMNPVNKKLNEESTFVDNYFKVYIGGTPGDHNDDSNENFVGCLKRMLISENFIDLRTANESHIHHLCPLS